MHELYHEMGSQDIRGVGLASMGMQALKFFAQVISPTVFIHNLTVEARSEREARRLIRAWIDDKEPPEVHCTYADFNSTPTGKPRIQALKPFGKD